MGRKIASRCFMSMTITLFMFVIGNYPNVYATMDSIYISIHLRISLYLYLYLYINSHITNALNDNHGYVNDLIPFP